MNIKIEQPIPIDALDHLSPSSLSTYLECPQKWYAKYVEGVKEKGSEYATFGTVGHRALELFFIEGGHKIEDPDFQEETLNTCLTKAVNEELTSTSDGWAPYKEMKKILKTWLQRQRFNEFDMLATEKEYRLSITSPGGITVDFLMYMDRIDRGETERDEGKVRVVDYKFGWMIKSAQELADDIQAQTYLLALMNMFPNQDMYAFRIESMRNNAVVGVRLSKSQLEQWRHVLGLRVDDIFGATEFPARLGSGCRYCPVKAKCPAAKLSIKNGGIDALEPTDLVNHHISLRAQKAQIELQINESEAALPAVLDRAPSKKIETKLGIVSSVFRKNTAVDREIVSKMVDKDTLAAIGAQKYTLSAWREDIEAEEDEGRKEQMQDAMEDRPTSAFNTKVQSIEEREAAEIQRQQKAKARKANKG